MLNCISGEKANMPFVLSYGTAFSEGANFSEGNEKIDNNCPTINGGEQSESSSTIYNI